MKNYLSSLFFTFTFAITSVLYSAHCYSEQANSAYENALSYLQQGKLDEAEISVKNSIIQRPNYLPARLLLGDILLQKGRPQSAEKELTIALALQADSFAVVIPLVEAKLFLYKHQEALTLLNEHPQLATERKYFLLQGNAYKALTKRKLAKKSYQQSLYIHGETIALYTAMADLAFKEGQLSNALNFANKALLIIPQPSDIQQNRQQQGAKILKAEILKSTKQPDEALAIYSEILQKEPTNQQALFGKATIFLDQNQLEDALIFSLTLRENYPNDPYIKLLHSSIIALQGNEKQARILLRDIQQQFMNFTDEQMQGREVLLLAASVDYLNKSYYQARRQFLTYIRDYGENTVAHRHLTMIALKENNVPLAQQHIGKALILSPNKAELYLLASHIYQQQLDKYEYLSFIEKAQAKFADNLLLRDQYIGALIAVNRSDDAIALLNKISGSNTLASRTLLGYLQLQANNIEQAKITTQALLDDHPNKVEILQLAGELSLKLGRGDDAIKLFKQTLVLDDKFRPALLALAGISLNNKDHQQTQLYYRQLLTFYPSDALVLQLYANFSINQQQLFLAIKLLSQIPKQHPDYIINQRALLTLYLKTNQLKQTEKTLALLESFYSLDQELLLAKSKLQTQLGETVKAAKTLKILFGLIYDDVKKIETLSKLQIDLADIEAAQRSIDRIKHLSNGKISPYIATRFALANKETKKAGKLIAQQLSKAPNNIAWLELKVHYLMAKPDIHKASELLNELYQTHNKREHLQLLAQLYLQQQQTDKVELLLKDWLSTQNADAWAIAQLSAIAIQNGNISLAISTLEHFKYIEQQPIFLNNLANLYQDNDPKKALLYAKKSHKLAPKLAAINDTLGWLLVINNQAQTGLSYLREAIARDVNNASYHYHLAYTLAVLKRLKLAQSALIKAQKLAPEHKLNSQTSLLINKG
ncbi:MAG: tetratricopeptide repeat protein [Colwellia sp.]|nr:tetratricopeptide repeat protein [Colwellia sp.]